MSSDKQNLDRHTIEGAGKVFAEKASGADRDGPALKEMIEFAREGDTVIAHSLDRLARDMRDLLEIVEMLSAKGVSVEFASERLRFPAGAEAEQDPFARLQLHMVGAFAQFERSMIRKRQKEGIAKAKAKGVYMGRKPSIDREELERIHKEEGLGATQIAKRFGIGKASIYKILN